MYDCAYLRLRLPFAVGQLLRRGPAGAIELLQEIDERRGIGVTLLRRLGLRRDNRLHLLGRRFLRDDAILARVSDIAARGVRKSVWVTLSGRDSPKQCAKSR